MPEDDGRPIPPRPALPANQAPSASHARSFRYSNQQRPERAGQFLGSKQSSAQHRFFPYQTASPGGRPFREPSPHVSWDVRMSQMNPLQVRTFAKMMALESAPVRSTMEKWLGGWGPSEDEIYAWRAF